MQISSPAAFSVSSASRPLTAVSTVVALELEQLAQGVARLFLVLDDEDDRLRRLPSASRYQLLRCRRDNLPSPARGSSDA